MDLYMTEKDTGKKIALSLLPNSVKMKAESNVLTYNFITVGEVKMPNGQTLLEFSWSGTLPGASKKNLPFVKAQHWKAPKEIINTFEQWRKNGTKIVLMLTETPINCAVYLSSFTPEWSGGSGDVAYDISFTEAKDVMVYTIVEARTTPSTQSANTSSGTRPASSSTNTSTNSEQTKTYTVKSGDCLWNIAKKCLGSGAKYTTIYNLNKKVIGSNPNLIYPGQVLVLPY